MIIWSQDNETFVESKNVLSFFTRTDSATYYVATRGAGDISSVVLGEYKTLQDAKKALQDLFNVLTSEHRTSQTSYQIQ